MFGELPKVTRIVAATYGVALVLLLTACDVMSRDRSGQCSYVIVEAQATPVQVFLGVCSEQVASIPDLRPVMAGISSAEELLNKVGSIRPLAIFVAGAVPSAGRTRTGPGFCALRGEDVQLLVLMSTERCPSKSESQYIVRTASRLSHELSWSLLDPDGKTRFRDALLRELQDSNIEDLRLLSFSLGEPVP
jgi:hypothetical protein